MWSTHKSTLEDWCLRHRRELTDVFVLDENDYIVRVKPGSPVLEQAIIGHSNQSATFIPDVIDTQDPGTVYIDCPGFLDNVS